MLLLTKPCKNIAVILSLNSIVTTQTATDIIALILHAILDDEYIISLFFNISFSETIFVIASGIANNEIVIRKLNILVINEYEPSTVVPILFVIYTFVIICIIFIMSVEIVRMIKFLINCFFKFNYLIRQVF